MGRGRGEPRPPPALGMDGTPPPPSCLGGWKGPAGEDLEPTLPLPHGPGPPGVPLVTKKKRKKLKIKIKLLSDYIL